MHRSSFGDPASMQPVTTTTSLPSDLSMVKEFRMSPAASAAIVSSSTSSPPRPPCSSSMRPPPPPPPPKNSRGVAAAHEVKSERNHEEPSSSIPDLEFDGTTVLCRVCGDKASGFHYGVHSCEGCKGFFRRSIQQKIQYRPCTKNQQCSILRINRNRCQYCRLKKCIAVGMSRDAVRFGRVPKREKARILAAMQQSSNSRSQEKAVSAELEDEQRLLATVIRAHLDTCEFTRDKVEPMLIRARDQPSYTACPPTLACPLNPNPQPLTGQQELLQDFSKRFSPAIRGVVEFAKRIPGFALLPQDDQVTLLKAGVFEVLLVRLACMFDSQTNSMICLNGQVLKRESIHNNSNARFLMDSMFDFAERLNALNLSDAEVGLFSSVVVIAPDRPGLRNTELIERMQNKLKNALQMVISQNHPGQPSICHELMKKIPDLRTLNTLHSEKLLAFKMTEQQQQLAQQHQQHQQHQHSMWGVEDESNSKSPAGSSSWSSSSDATMDEAVKSPLGSVSSTESVCSGEVAALSEYQQSHHVAASHQASSAPLLAATLAGGGCPHRRRANSGSTSGDDDMVGLPAHMHHHSLTITSVNGPQMGSKPMQQHHRFRKLDSPSDSGIESGTEKLSSEKHTSRTSSAPTSVCSSPRSSLEDKDDHHNSHIEDMPVLKRVLQAPPLYDTNSLMDEAYKPHKKFRALRNNSAEAEPMVVVSTPSVAVAAPAAIAPHHSSPHLHHHLTSNHSSPLASALTSSLTSSLLSSTHSTLAKSLMEGPRMTAEQMKRTDIIHNYIMRGESTPHHGDFPSPMAATASTTTASSASASAGGYKSTNGGNLLVCATSSASNGGYHFLPQQMQSRWPVSQNSGSCTSVITTTTGCTGAGRNPSYVLVPNSTSSPPPPPPPQHKVVHMDQSSNEFASRLYFHPHPQSHPVSHPQSPHHASSSTSPSPLHRRASPAPCPQASAALLHSPSSTATIVVNSAAAPKIMELQVEIANGQQPLNLSKKSPSPSPRLIISPAHKVVSLEA